MASKATIRWRDEPEGDDYPAALAYLSLTFKPKVANAFVQKLRDAKITKFEAKDVFRASGLPELGVSNWHVKKDRKRIHDGKSLAPLLLVRMPELGKVIIADGYHRLCAVYSYDEDAVIPCKIV